MTDQTREPSQLTFTGGAPDGGPADGPMQRASAATSAPGTTNARPAERKKTAMTREFFSQAKGAVQSLHRAQDQRARHEAIAQERRDRAETEYRAALSRAAAFEAKAWHALLAIPGVTSQTAAILCGVSVATVHRRVKEARDV